MKRLIFFVGVYDTLDIFTYELVREFETIGYEIMIFDSRNMENSLGELARFIEKPVKAVITFNNLGFNMELVAGQNIWNVLQIPCINILMDHPFCYKTALDAAPNNAIVLCTDRNHMRYVERFYPQIPVTGYLPHAGKERPVKRKPLKERSIDVMYAGGLSKAFAESVTPDLSKFDKFDAKKICEQAYEDLIAHPYKTTEQALEDALCANGVCVSESELCSIIADLHFVDLYAVSYYRERAVRVLAEAGIAVTIYGSGWEECEWIKRPNVTYAGRISAEEVVDKMQDAKIVLNTMTWFKDGTHDRVFNGMLQGAVAVTDSSIYMKEEFCGKKELDTADKRELVMFELEEIDSLPEQVEFLLSNLDVAQDIADRGFEKAKNGHTWHDRAMELERDLLSQL